MNTLRALDGIARHGSMSRAARELHVTPSAISHAIRALEDELGFPLIVRGGRSAVLTRAGLVYAQEVRKALSILADAHSAAFDARLEGHFTVSCTPGLATFWLMGHIGEFRDLFPRVGLRIVSSEAFETLSDPDVDLFVAFGSGTWRGYTSELLTPLNLAPYCSPALLNAMGGVAEAADLVRFPLLHLRDHHDWTRWLSAASVNNLAAETGIVMSNMYLVLTAALQGLGVAIGDNIACRTALADGRLVRPVPLSITSTEAYYFVSEPAKHDLPIARAFRDWMRSRIMD
ncbi:LysR substrate-binding domain-containing protein [Acuticoccus kandeliae]|uniref:LysR substrate-binding domain-containing protein n=1 Tax=Acuticoccus kandeliae TaxID=2073160 RepID=UPI000D3E81E1|nr:LysR substrate-binding domain-containing protein [Acuticoccus kandeliae]